MSNEKVTQILGIDESSVQSTGDFNSDPSTQFNKVVNVNLVGGIIGFLAISPRDSLSKVIAKENANGWKVVQIIPVPTQNFLLIILRILITIITLLLYTPIPGYYIIFERKN